MTEKKLPTVTTLRRWKRDALEEAFECKKATDPTMRKWKLMFENFASICDVITDNYPEIFRLKK